MADEPCTIYRLLMKSETLIQDVDRWNRESKILSKNGSPRKPAMAAGTRHKISEYMSES